MQKKNIMVIVGVVIFCISLGYIGYKKYTINNLKQKAEQSQINLNNTEEINKKEDTKTDDLSKIDYYGLPEGFVTSIKTKEELKEGEEFKQANFLRKKSNYNIEEVLKAKRVSENFIQAILSFDRENPTEYSDVALRYMDKSLEKNFKYELEDIKKTSGMNPYKECKPFKVHSHEKSNIENDYLEFEAYVVLDNIDNRDQNIGNNLSPYYVIQLLPINGEWKIVNYHLK